MFDKLLGYFKKNQPGSNRNSPSSDENQEEDYSEEVNEDSHDTSANESSAADKKKKQTSMIIRVIVVLALGYMAATEFIFKPEPEVVAIPARPSKRKKKPLKPSETAKDVKTAATADPENKKMPLADEKPLEKTLEKKAELEVVGEEQKAEEKLSPVENINIADKTTMEKPQEKSQEKAIDETPILKTPEEVPPKVGEVKASEGGVEKSIDLLIDNMDSKSAKEGDTEKKSKLEEKIVTDDVYTPPPAYDQLGRGLVYNCKDKFWACIDKTAYIACNKNMKWNKTHSKAAECAVSNVYNSDEDCSTVQKYNVSTNTPTPFCQ